MISEMKRSGQGQNITLTRSKLRSWFQLIQLIWYCLWLVSKSQTVLWLAGWTINRWISTFVTDRQTDKQTDRQTDIVDCWTATFAVKNVSSFHFQSSIFFWFLWKDILCWRKQSHNSLIILVYVLNAHPDLMRSPFDAAVVAFSEN